tara:strand:- start:4192 stop:4659 length:468 start_codon:yes stop_codon:yes gene_type:complete
MTTTREATIDDLETILDFNQRLFDREVGMFDPTLDDTWTQSEEGRDYFTKRIQEDGCAFVAEVNGQVVGYLVGALLEPSPYRTIPKMAELENMYVLPNFRSQGVGTRLYNDFKAWAKEQGAGRLKVVASAGNQPGINFYQDHGFEAIDVTLEVEI